MQLRLGNSDTLEIRPSEAIENVKERERRVGLQELEVDVFAGAVVFFPALNSCGALFDLDVVGG